ncbi:hypothetical protein BDZ45DRAFT_750655 [Acephala macrosclerotiorum]|nr:hypothetical protein BDZ45DRAFT_750655 [Acephala macrosclerotiorum]
MHLDNEPKLPQVYNCKKLRQASSRGTKVKAYCEPDNIHIPTMPSTSLYQPWKKWYSPSPTVEVTHFVVPVMAAGNADTTATIEDPADLSGSPKPKVTTDGPERIEASK